MDRNSIIGVVLIGIILIGYSIYTQPSAEETAALKQKADSLEIVRIETEKQFKLDSIAATNKTMEIDTTVVDSTVVDTVATDSIKAVVSNNKFGVFADASIGEDSVYYYIENDLLKLKISSKAGRIVEAIVKDYQTYDSLPLNLLREESSKFNLSFFVGNLVIQTEDLYFKAFKKDDKKLILRAYAGSEDKYIEYSYDLNKNNYFLDFDINFNGLNEIIPENRDYITLNWEQNIPKQELGAKNENTYTTIYYKPLLEDPDYLSETSDKTEDVNIGIRWISFKDQFFSSTLISKNDGFLDARLETKILYETDSDYIKNVKAEISIPFKGKKSENNSFYYYLGPNKYKTYAKYSEPEFTGLEEDLNLQKLIPLGWGIFSWVNRFAIIPIFNFLNSFISNYGLIIFLLTIIIKLVLFPLTYKSYLSTAKMRVLKPQIDEINKKIPKDKPMERQQATMALYKKVGVNPMGGCLPMLLQFPILLAMFRFFPASIELRQQSFLWAHDLSTYDSILTLPFTIPIYGNHISLFTILMTISTLLYTKMQNEMNSANASMPGMKQMMYIMPIMFMVMLNNYSSGLTYYYFLANMITFSQMYFIKSRINDDDILRKLETSKKKVKKPSKFQQRIEAMAKQRGK